MSDVYSLRLEALMSETPARIVPSRIAGREVRPPGTRRMSERIEIKGKGQVSYTVNKRLQGAAAI